jgi:hypothetical protein
MEVDGVEPLPTELLWLLDAPLFIDVTAVEAFYDAILRPDYEGSTLTLSDSIKIETQIGTKTSVGIAFPWFGKAGVDLSVGGTRGTDRGREATLTAVTNPYRHLLAVGLHYAGQQDDNRLVVVDPSAERVVNGRGASMVADFGAIRPPVSERIRPPISAESDPHGRVVVGATA